MADQFLQVAVGPTGTTTDQCTLTVAAHSTIVAFLWRGDGAATVHTVSDGQGSYTLRGPSAFDSTNGVWVQAFVLEDANSGSHTLTGTIDTGGACFIVAVEIAAAAGGGTYSGSSSAAQSAPGTGTDGVSSGSATVTGAATLIAMSTDSGSTATSDEPAAGTGFTSRSNAANGFIGAYRIETKAVAANAAGTFTGITGFHNFVTAAVAILNPVAPTLEDTNRRTNAGVAGVRQPVSMPQVITAGLALFLTGAQGPTVPAGDPASPAAQTVAAYREAGRLPQAPQPRVTQGGVAAGVPISVPPVVLVQQQAWPYAAIQAAEATASQFGIPDADLIFDRLKPDIVPTRTWNYAAAMPAPEIAPLIQQPAQVLQVPVAQVAQRDWPYHEFTLPDVPSAAATLFGTTQVYLGAPSVAQLTQQAWPYASATAIHQGPAATSPVAAAVPFAATLQVSASPWAYALVQPDANAAFFGITAITLAPPAVQQPPAAPWPHWLAQAARDAPIASPVAQVSPPVVAQLQGAPAWPYLSAMLPATASQFGIPGPGIVFAQPGSIIAQQAWPYAAAMPQAQPTAAQFGAAPGYLQGPPLAQYPQQPWPYASAMAVSFGPASTYVAPAVVPWVPTAQPAAQPWAHALLQPKTNAAFFGAVPVYLAGPPTVQYRVAPWPYASIMPVSRATQGTLNPFVYGNTEAWLVDARSRAWQVERRDRAWLVEDH